MKPFNLIERSRDIEKIVMEDGKRKYYRFRYSRYYGGIVTADTIGCNLLCAYCWNYLRNLHPEKHGKLYTPEAVAKNLVKISRKKNVNLFRISGAEPILGKKSIEHLVKVIELIDSEIGDSEFILETNGLMLGYEIELANMLKGLNIAVRITVKGWDEESFEKITGAEGENFRYQIAAIEELLKRKMIVWPAVMYDVFREEGIRTLKEKLKDIGVDRVESEYLERYPFVMKHLRKRGIKV
ncbi:MAG: radical SAM protein [Promethearchaeota archaeon]